MEKQITNEKAFITLLSVFIGCITIASVLSGKIIDVFGFFVPAGILAYSVTFTCTDVISELWGPKRSRYVVSGGFIALLVVLLLVQISIHWPSAPFWNHSVSFTLILRNTSRIIIASFVAYLISQFHDIWAFHFWKKITGPRHLWLRNNLSTATSQFIDSVIFIIIAFYGVMPVWPLIFGQWVVKLTISVLDTPIIYFVIWLIRENEKDTNKDTLSLQKPFPKL